MPPRKPSPRSTHLNTAHTNLAQTPLLEFLLRGAALLLEQGHVLVLVGPVVARYRYQASYLSHLVSMGNL